MPSPFAPALPFGQRIYAVGDIHGRADLLGRMAGLIEADCRQRPVATAGTVFLGDYIDRGPDSRGVLARLAAGDFPTPIVTLRGNHESLFQQFLQGRLDIPYYGQLGGDATLRSYGVDLARLAGLGVEARHELLHTAIPAAHRALVDTTQLSVDGGDYFFCHAGVRPGVPFAAQSEDDLLWIRTEFLSSAADFGKIVVHGHTPVRMPEVRPNRINVDTKAFASGILTAVVLEGSERRFLRT